MEGWNLFKVPTLGRGHGIRDGFCFLFNRLAVTLGNVI